MVAIHNSVNFPRTSTLFVQSSVVFVLYTDSSTRLTREENKLHECTKWWPLVERLCRFLLDDWRRLPKDDCLFQVCLYSLPSILRQLGIFVEHVENMPCSSVIFLSIHRLLIKGHKELYEGTVFF